MKHQKKLMYFLKDFATWNAIQQLANAL